MEEKTLKTGAIVADNYKLKKFQKELTKKGFTDFKIEPFRDETSVIKVKIPSDKVKEIEKICKLVELHFKRSN